MRPQRYDQVGFPRFGVDTDGADRASSSASAGCLRAVRQDEVGAHRVVDQLQHEVGFRRSVVDPDDKIGVCAAGQLVADIAGGEARRGIIRRP
jgi:hypothetical protein